MPLQIIHGDITTMACDAIVNPTDNCFSGSGGIRIHTHYGLQKQRDNCKAKCRPGLNIQKQKCMLLISNSFVLVGFKEADRTAILKE